MQHLCEACGESFEDDGLLRQHLEQVHAASGETAKDSDEIGGTTTPTAGGASRVQTE